MKKITTKEKVNQNLDALKGMSHGELFKWARSNEINSAPAFSAFKKALLEHEIDYDKMRLEKRIEKHEIMKEAATVTLILYSDAKARTNRFGICDKNGNPVWFGMFFDRDDFNGEQSSGEMEAAKKAVWLASKVMKSLKTTAINLHLNVDAEWLVWANQTHTHDERGGKARDLGIYAEKLGVVLHVEHIPGEKNPADKYTICSGVKHWHQNDLSSLVSESSV